MDSLGIGLAGLLEGTQPGGYQFEVLGLGDILIEQAGHRLIELEDSPFELEDSLFELENSQFERPGDIPFEEFEDIPFEELGDNPDLDSLARLVDSLAMPGSIPDCLGNQAELQGTLR